MTVDEVQHCFPFVESVVGVQLTTSRDYLALHLPYNHR